MNTKTKRRFSAWLLLSVFLPMLVFSSLHVHERMAVWQGACVDCVNHLPHAGHLSLDTHSPHDCVLCQFTSLPVLLGVAVAVGMVVVQSPRLFNLCLSFVPGPDDRLLASRAPPVV